MDHGGGCFLTRKQGFLKKPETFQKSIFFEILLGAHLRYARNSSINGRTCQVILVLHAKAILRCFSFNEKQCLCGHLRTWLRKAN